MKLNMKLNFTLIKIMNIHQNITQMFVQKIINVEIKNNFFATKEILKIISFMIKLEKELIQKFLPQQI